MYVDILVNNNNNYMWLWSLIFLIHVVNIIVILGCTYDIKDAVMAVHERNDEQSVPYVDRDIASHRVKAVRFQVYNDAELRKLCVKQLHDSETFDCLGHATSGGLYDLELGIYFPK